ncbi:MAG: class I SAM-dependent methyltransferase [Betaproteobacteria bacterium]
MAHVSLASPALTFTGERFTPEVRGPIWYEHWHRYAFVAELARGRRVLDAACGEGYGSFLIAHTAAQVTGVDISPEAVAHARERYPLKNLAFTQGSVTKIPLPDASVDVVVSFETIEHLPEQREMLAEFRRVLTAAGILVISSPNRPVYNEAGEVENNFHVAELDRAELKALLDPAFPQQLWFGQRVVAQSLLWAEGGTPAPAQFLTLPEHEAKAAQAPAPPMYFVVVCASAAAHLPPCPALSLFDDGALALWRDYARALMRERQLAWDEIDAHAIAQDRLAELIVAVNALASERDSRIALDRHIVHLKAELATAQATVSREVAAHVATRERLDYRESARGWLRLPFALIKRRLSESR